MSKDRKPFKDTAVFKAIKNIAPEILDTVTDVAASVYPPLGIVNNLVDKALDKAKEKKMSVKDLTVLGEARQEYEDSYKDYLQDIQDARAMYKEKSDMADSIAKKIIDYNLWLLLLLVLVQVIVIMFVEGQIAAVITGVVGTITGALINERNTVVNFFFGSSQGSKDKDNGIV